MSSKQHKFPENDYLFPPVAESSRLLVACRAEDYSASRIAHAVEDCDAHLLNLNVTSMGYKTDDEFERESHSSETGKFPVVFDLRVSHRNPESISRSLERYGYTVLRLQGNTDPDEEKLRSRIDNLFRYLEI